jgi:hypothetical protein
MSALPPKADIAGRRLDVRFVPKAEVAVIRSVELIVQPDTPRRAADFSQIAKLPELLSRRQTWGVR